MADERTIELIQRVFSRPEYIPEDAINYLTDQFALNQPQVPYSQVFGASAWMPKVASVTASETIAATAFGDLATVGPTLSNLPAGSYLVLGVAQANISVAGHFAIIGVSVNSATPTEDLAYTGVYSSTMGVWTKTLSGTGANSLKMKYRTTSGAATGTFDRRWLVALRYANP